MEMKFSYLKAMHSAVLYLWELNGKDENNKPVNLYVRHIKNKPEPNVTFFEAVNVVAELENNMLILKDEEFTSWREEWKYDPDHPRNLAKSVTVK